MKVGQVQALLGLPQLGVCLLLERLCPIAPFPGTGDVSYCGIHFGQFVQGQISEGLVVDLTGPGRVLLQSRSTDQFLAWLIPQLPFERKGEGD